MPRAVSHLGQRRRHIRRRSHGRQPAGTAASTIAPVNAIATHAAGNADARRPIAANTEPHCPGRPGSTTAGRASGTSSGAGAGSGDVHALAGHHQTTRVDTIGRAGQQTHLVLARLDAEHTEIIRVDDTNVGDPIRQRVPQHLDREPVSDMTLPRLRRSNINRSYPVCAEITACVFVPPTGRLVPYR